VAHGEHGDRASAYIARDILAWYKEHRLKNTYEAEPYEKQYILRGNVKVPYASVARPRYRPVERTADESRPPSETEP